MLEYDMERCVSVQETRYNRRCLVKAGAAHLPGRNGSCGGIAKDNRRFINAIFWIMRTGSSWRNVQPDLGDWSNTHRRFISWGDAGVWERMLEVLIDDPDFACLMIEATFCKVHPDASGARGGNQKMSRTKGAQHKTAFGRGFAWYADQSYYYRRYSCRLQQGDRVN